jgi:hypothetical protein
MTSLHQPIQSLIRSFYYQQIDAQECKVMVLPQHSSDPNAALRLAWCGRRVGDLLGTITWSLEESATAGSSKSAELVKKVLVLQGPS